MFMFLELKKKGPLLFYVVVITETNQRANLCFWQKNKTIKNIFCQDIIVFNVHLHFNIISTLIFFL